MNIRDLRYLVALAEHGHFGRAAKACFVSQPALSMQIKKLEETLGIALLERTNKKVLLTEPGRLITQHAKEILYQVETMHAVAEQAKEPFSGSLILGIIPTLAPYLLPCIIPTLSTEFPKLNLYLRESLTENLLTQLNEGQLDCALLALPLSEIQLESTPLFTEEFVLTTPINHPFAALKTVDFSHLNQQTLLLLEEGHCLRDQTLALCQKTHASEFPTFQASSLETLRHMVISHAGITLLPKLACQPNEQLAYIPFDDPKPVRTIGMVWRKSSAKKILLDQLAKKISDIMR